MAFVKSDIVGVSRRTLERVKPFTLILVTTFACTVLSVTRLFLVEPTASSESSIINSSAKTSGGDFSPFADHAADNVMPQIELVEL